MDMLNGRELIPVKSDDLQPHMIVYKQFSSGTWHSCDLDKIETNSINGNTTITLYGYWIPVDTDCCKDVCPIFVIFEEGKVFVTTSDMTATPSLYDHKWAIKFHTVDEYKAIVQYLKECDFTCAEYGSLREVGNSPHYKPWFVTNSAKVVLAWSSAAVTDVLYEDVQQVYTPQFKAVVDCLKVSSDKDVTLLRIKQKQQELKELEELYEQLK